jgi:hypothetical protein
MFPLHSSDIAILDLLPRSGIFLLHFILILGKSDLHCCSVEAFVVHFHLLLLVFNSRNQKFLKRVKMRTYKIF